MENRIAALWANNRDAEWREQEKHYYDPVKSANFDLENALENYPIDNIRKMTVKEFYEFLYNEYFVWKYTAANRLVTTRRSLEKHNGGDEILAQIQVELLAYVPDHSAETIKKGLKIVKRIKGLGVAGASGLLSLLYPDYFGTVDQFVVDNLVAAGVLQEGEMNKKSLGIKNGVRLIEIMRKKADELNSANHTDYWTPRKIDRVLWGVR